MNKKYIIIGDVHGYVDLCNKVCLNNPDKTIIQIGDLGIGFVKFELIEKLPTNFKFFVGNHDCRDSAGLFTSCLGDFGEYGPFFFLSGADSIDRSIRTEGLNWWSNEQLSLNQCQEAIDKWAKSDCEILLSHDAPQSIVEGYYLIYDRTLTRLTLDEMIKIRKPKIHIYGHHHKSKRLNIDGIQFIGLGINEVIDL